MSGEQDGRLFCNTSSVGGQDEEKVYIFRMSFFLVTTSNSSVCFRVFDWYNWYTLSMLDPISPMKVMEFGQE